MNRRTFIQSSGASLAATAAGLSASAATPQRKTRASSRRPNLLVISTDQQYADAMSCAGNPHLRTPAMDRIAREGTIFERAYCSSPICVPSRTSYMTGLMPHETRILSNAHKRGMAGDCLGKWFRDAGYDTGYVGKWHVPRPLADQAWSGFDYLAALRNNRVDFDLPAAAETFLRRPRGDQPFLLFASFLNPHDICEWARIASGISDELKNGDIGAVPPPEQCPPIMANHRIPEREPSVIREHQAEPGNAGTYPTRNWGGPEDGRWRQYLWAYYRMTELVDGYIGRILDVLRDTGQEEDTAIVFFSDHGDGLGAHRWNQKTLFYEECARVPFVISWKGHTPPGRRDQSHLVNLGIDLAPTLLDFAGVPVPASLRGESLKALAMDTPDSVKRREFVLSQNNLHRSYTEASDAHGRMVRSGRYKYVRYNIGSDREQLFDLELDPREVTNLVADSGHAAVLTAHRRMLDETIAATGDFFPRFAA